MKPKIRLSFIGLISLINFVFFNCDNSTENYIDVRGTEYSGSIACVQCHQSIYNAVIQSSHSSASGFAAKNNIYGSFKKGKNEFVYNQGLKLVMEKRKDGFYQVLYQNGKEIKAYRFDIFFGTKNAQTWLYLDEDKAYELPISYYASVDNWGTSPGFNSVEPFFGRLIEKDCFSCHSSNISSKQEDGVTEGTFYGSTEIGEVMDRKSLLLGIDCERCHGPATEHVEYHLNNPEDKTAKHIVTHNSLSQQQRLDVCAVCHSGNNKIIIKPRFKFKPGDTLSNFLMKFSTRNDDNDIDVHGNQYELMSQSKCFVASKGINCITCHDPHRNAVRSLEYYSKICMSCHSDVNHQDATLMTSKKSSFNENCIDCHMPKKASGAINFKVSGSSEKFPYNLRTHKIAVYP